MLEETLEREGRHEGLLAESEIRLLLEMVRVRGGGLLWMGQRVEGLAGSGVAGLASALTVHLLMFRLTNAFVEAALSAFFARLNLLAITSDMWRCSLRLVKSGSMLPWESLLLLPVVLTAGDGLLLRNCGDRGSSNKSGVSMVRIARLSGYSQSDRASSELVRVASRSVREEEAVKVSEAGESVWVGEQADELSGDLYKSCGSVSRERLSTPISSD